MPINGPKRAYMYIEHANVNNYNKGERLVPLNLFLQISRVHSKS